MPASVAIQMPAAPHGRARSLRMEGPHAQRQAVHECVPRGFVHIDGEFSRTHRADIERLMHNEASRARQNNPLQQVLDWQEFRNGALVVNTSTEHFAQRLGRALETAYDGIVRYRFCHQTKVAHVWWSR